MTTNSDDDGIEVIPGPQAGEPGDADDGRSVTDLVEPTLLSNLPE